MADLYLPTLMSAIINDGVMRGDTAAILRIGGRMILVTAGSLLSAVVASFFSSGASAAFGRDVRRAVFAKVESFSLHEFDELGTATLITRSTNDVTQVQNVTVMVLRMMVMAPLMAIGAIFMAYQRDRGLTLVLAVAVPVLAACIGVLASVALPWFKEIQKKVDRLNLVLREGLTGIRVIRAFNRSSHEEARFERANEDITRVNVRVNRIMAFAMPGVMLIMNLTSLSILWFGVHRIDSGGMQLGSLMAFIQYAMQVMFGFMMMAMMFIMVPRASAAADRINEVLDVEPGILDPEKPELPSNATGEVEFRGVSFSYHGAEECALKDVSFRARRGEVTAIIGSTGAGKSTLTKLIPRFYDASSGSVLVDGVDVRRMRQERLRSLIGYVPQKALLFSGTIAEKPALRRRGGRRRADPGGGGHRPGAGIHRVLRGRFRAPHRAGRGGHFRRAEAEALHRPSPGQEARDLHFRRQLLGAGLQDGRQAQGGAQGKGEGIHRHPGVPARGYGDGRGRHHRPGRGQGRGDGPAQGAPGLLPGLPRDRPVPALRGGNSVSDHRNPSAGGPIRRGPVMGPGGAMMRGPAEKAKNFGSSLKRLVGYLRPHRLRLGVVFVLAIASTGFTISAPKISGRIMNKIKDSFMARMLLDGMEKAQEGILPMLPQPGAAATPESGGDIPQAPEGMGLAPEQGEAFLSYVSSPEGRMALGRLSALPRLRDATDAAVKADTVRALLELTAGLPQELKDALASSAAKASRQAGKDAKGGPAAMGNLKLTQAQLEDAIGPYAKPAGRWITRALWAS
jgi:ABC-type multidrug transport system fused ATPase/permease subunit